MESDNKLTLPCADKLAFDSKKQADAAAAVAKHQHDTNVASYICRHCGLWHLKSVFKT